jgi:pimeloyl-ACP methyl ester carboxylesterase
MSEATPEHDATGEPPSFLTILSAVALAPLGLVLLLAGVTSIGLGRLALTGWGWLWSIESIALGVGLLAWSSRSPRFTALRRGGTIALFLLALVRLVFFGGTEEASIVVLDHEGHVVGASRWIDRLFEERDASMVGSRLLTLVGAVPSREFPALPELLERSYPQTEADAPRLGTPIPATLLDLQRADAFDTIVVEPRGAASDIGVVFLHGFAGSFALQCLEVAHVAREGGARTVCPATSFVGAWWQGDGEAIVRGSIAHLRSRGARRIVLVGLSNGGIGASRLAPRLRGEIDALVLLSGVAPSAPTPRVPTLVVQGDDDTMVQTRAVRAWARGRSNVRYVELAGTHFVLLERREQIGAVLAEALRRETERALRSSRR